jgi:hypothetical protein
MEFHAHFMNIAALEFPIFDIIENTPIKPDSIDFIINNCIGNCFKKLQDNIDTKKEYLKLLRLLLCKQYKLNYEDNRKKTRFCSQHNQFVESLIQSKLCREKENQSILYDIMVLQLILLQDPTNFIQLFEHFRTNTISNQLHVDNKILTYWYLRTLKCFLNAWDMYYFLNRNNIFGFSNITHLECYKEILLSSIINDLKNWIECKESHEWHALYSLLLKVVSITKDTTILSPYVHEIIDKKFDLTTLCVICNFIFPSNLNIDIDYSLIYSDKLWSTIQLNFLSFNSYERKQALYLFKRLIDFINANESNIKNSIPTSTQIKIKPFICDQNKSAQLSIKQIRINFILIIEALEEKQKHLVVPNLSFVDNLIQGYIEHKFCGNCYDFSWIYCIFARILMHDNHKVIKWGILRLLRLNTEFYSYDQFIMLIVKALNNTFLYEKYCHENEPSIVTALIGWFNNYQSENLRLVEKFICCLDGISWGPIPIYYILQSLFLTSHKLEYIVTLQEEQFDAIKFIMKTNINLYPSMLQSMSQIMLVKILSRFSAVQNLISLSNLLSIFSVKNLRELSCWAALISWLAKIPYTNVLNFINQVCETLTADDENVQILMSSLALIIELLYEGGIICQTEQCIVTQKLIKLFICLDKINVRPYVNVSFTIKIIDLLYNLLDIQSNQTLEFIHKIFINYKETLFRFILTLFNNENLNYKYIKICLRALQNINYYENGKVYTTSIITSNNIKELEEKCIQVISNINEYNEIQLLFALQSWSNISSYYKYKDKFFLEQIHNILEICSSENGKHKLTGKMRLDYYVALSKLIKNHILTLPMQNLKQNDNWFKIISFILDAAGNDVLIYFGDILQYYIINTLDDDRKLENVKYLIKSFWNCNFGSKREKIFWSAAQKINQCIISSEFLKNESLQEIFQEVRLQYCYTNFLLLHLHRFLKIN